MGTDGLEGDGAPDGPFLPPWFSSPAQLLHSCFISGPIQDNFWSSRNDWIVYNPLPTRALAMEAPAPAPILEPETVTAAGTIGLQL